MTDLQVSFVISTFIEKKFYLPYVSGVDFPESKSRSRYSTCLSPLGLIIGLFPPSRLLLPKILKVQYGKMNSQTFMRHTVLYLVYHLYKPKY